MSPREERNIVVVVVVVVVVSLIKRWRCGCYCVSLVEACVTEMRAWLRDNKRFKDGGGDHPLPSQSLQAEHLPHSNIGHSQIEPTEALRNIN